MNSVEEDVKQAIFEFIRKQADRLTAKGFAHAEGAAQAIRQRIRSLP